MKYCSKCGYANNDELTYCSCCGASLQIKKPEVVIDNTTKCCPKCGFQARGNEKFCASCGGLLDESSGTTGRGYKYCSKCGNQLFEEAVICVKCGCSVGNTNGYSNQKSSSDSGLAIAAKVLSIITCVGLGIFTIMWTYISIMAFAFAGSEEYEVLAVLGIYGLVLLIILVVDICMTVSLCRKLKNKEPIGIGFKICMLLFVNMIAGILLLCMKEYD